MKTDKVFSKKLSSRLDQKQDTLQKQPAVFAQNFVVANQINFNNVIIGDKTVPVYNDRVPARAGVKIWVGYDAIDQSDKKPKRFQVLGTRSEDPTGGQSMGLGYAPAKRYERNAEGGGQDPLHVHQRAITFLRTDVSRLAGNVNLYKGKIWTGTAFKNVPQQNVDISAQVPTTPGKAAFVMITINTSGVVIQTKGSEVNIADLAEADRPAVPASTAFVSACVRVYEGQVKPQDGRLNTDFDDLRFTVWNNSTGGGGVESVTGDGVDNTDPLNPVLSFPTPGDIGAQVAGTYLTSANIEDSISDGVTTKAPSENAVYDALAGKQAAGTYLTSANIEDAIVDAHTTIAPSGNAVYDALAALSVNKYPCNARLTLETGVPFSTAAQTAKTILYLTHYKGNQVATCTSGGVWSSLILGADISIKSIDAQTGTTHNGTKVIDGLTDTSQLIPGMKISGTNVGAGSTIATVDSPTQITGTVNSTGTASNTITFKLPFSSVFDLFVFNNSSSLKLEWCAWTNTTTRATALYDQDGVDTKTGDITRRYIGTIATTATDGQMEDSLTYHSIDNAYNNDEERLIGIWDSTDNWIYNTASFRSWNNSAANRVTFVIGKAHKTVALNFACYVYHTLGSPNNVRVGIGLDSVTVDASSMRAPASNGTASASYKSMPNIGLHYLQLLERGNGSGDNTYYGDNGTVDRSGATGYING